MRNIAQMMAWSLLVLILISGCSQTIEDKQERIKQHLMVGQFTEAQKKVEEIVAADSISPEAIYSQALIDEYLSYDWDAVIKHIEASRMRNGYLPSMRAFIRLAIDLDYLENARKMTRLLINRLPDEAEGYFYLATIDIAEMKFDSARANLSLAAARTDDSLDVILAEAAIDFHSFDKDAINKALERLSRTKLSNADHLRQLAELFRYLNMGDSAIFYGLKAVKEDDNNLNLKLQLVEYLFDEMRLAEAHELITDILAHAEESGRAQILAAKILWAAGFENQAEVHFFKFMKAREQSPISFEKHADFYKLFDQTNMAAIEYQAAFTMAGNLMYPDDYLRRLYIKMVYGFLDERDIGMGMDYYEEGKLLLPDNIDMYFIEATLKGSFDAVADSARMMIDDRIDNNWDNSQWLSRAAKYYYRRLNFDEAARIYERVIELPYPKLEYFTQLLEIYKENRDADGAKALADNLPFRFQNNIEIHKLLCDVYYGAGQVNKAAQYAKLLYQHTTEHMPYILLLVDLYEQQDRHDDARQLLTKFIDDFPQNPESHYRLARFDFRNGDYQSVLPLIEKSLAVDTGYAFAMELKGEYFQEQGNMDSAVAYYEKAIAIHWPTPLAYHNLAAYLLEQQKDLDRAAGLAMAAVHYFDKDRRGYLLLGNIYWAQGKFKLAQQNYYKGTVLFPDDAEYHFLLGKSYIDIGEKPKARESLRKALELNLPPPQKAEAESLLAEL